MRIYALLAILPLVCASVACAVQAPDRQENRLRAQLDDDWKYWMTQYPEVATALGYPGQDARWTDYSPGGHRRARRLSASRASSRLAAIDRARPRRRPIS